MAAKLKDKKTSITTVPNILRSFAIFATPLISHWSLPLNRVKIQNFEKRFKAKQVNIEAIQIKFFLPSSQFFIFFSSVAYIAVAQEIKGNIRPQT